MTSRRALKITLASIAVIALLVTVLFALILWEGSSARTDAPALEMGIAQVLLHYTVPARLRTMRNPLHPDDGDVAAGHEIFTRKCEICHAYDGGGKTEIGSGQYPRPPDLRSADVQRMSDGELFYHLKNGIRNTGMPAWTLADRKLWQVIAYVRHLPRVAVLLPPGVEPPLPTDSGAHYLGSVACQGCHAAIYARWRKTRMANVVQDPRTHPEAIIPDLSKPDPLLTFTKDEIALTYGSKWKQRYFKKVGDDYFVFPAQWDITHKMWRAYFVKNGTDWWAPPFTQPTTCNDRPARCATAATRSTTISTRRKLPSGMLAARDVTVRAASM